MKKAYQSPKMNSIPMVEIDVLTASGGLDDRILNLDDYTNGDKVKFGASN